MNPFAKIIVPIAILAILGGGVYWYSLKPSAVPTQMACTMEAKLCPDGSSVGRTGPNCEFAACPTVTSIPQQTSGIKGQVLLGPTCPVERDPPDPACADKPYKTTLVIMTPDRSKTVARFNSDTNGQFSVDVPPGSYIISQAAGGAMLPRCGTSGPITVPSGGYATTTISCDTGIR